MDLDGLEAEQAAIYARAGAESDNPPGPLALAVALFGEDRILYGGTDGRAALYDRDTGTLRLRRRGPHKQRAFALAHEVAEWWLSEHGAEAEELEALSDALAIRLLAPAPAFREAVKLWGRDVVQLADAFALTQTATVLRLGEVLRRPVIVVTSGKTWGGMIPHQLDLFVREHRAEILDGAAVRGWSRVAITDARRRVALVGE